MRIAAKLARIGLGFALNFAARPGVAQELPRVSIKRAISVAGLSVDRRIEDVLGLGRVKFQGLIAAELADVGYRLADLDAMASAPESLALALAGLVREEVCDDQSPSQCRIAIQWELQDGRAAAVYRTTTRAVDQAPSLDTLRRRLVQGALRSLLQRPHFALQFMEQRVMQVSADPLGFKRCQRRALALPDASRSAAAAVALVEAGSNLSFGSIVSSDGLILTSLSGVDASAPLFVRFAAGQKLPAKLVKLDPSLGLALVGVRANTEATCLPLRDEPLSVGDAVFGISSELVEGRAVSLAGSGLQATRIAAGRAMLETDALIARSAGGPLLDERGRLAGIVLAETAPHAKASVVAGASALAALGVKAAAITDPRLVRGAVDSDAPGYVRDQDDPPYVLTKRYTYGTSPMAHRVRTGSLVTAGIGAVVVAGTWLSFRADPNISPSEHRRAVVLNDLGWSLLGVGAIAFGISYVLPEGHEVVAVQNEARAQLFLGVHARGLTLGGRL